MSLKAVFTDIAKSSPALRALMRGMRYAFERAKYLPVRLSSRTDDKLVLFESYNGQSYACSPRAIYEEMLNNPDFSDYRFVWAFKKPDEKALPDSARTEKTVSGSREYFRICAKAGAIVINSSFAEGVTLRKDQILLETWHGTPLKRLGFDLSPTAGDKLNSARDNRRRYALNAKRFTYLLSPSPACSQSLRSAFALDRFGKADIIRETGYPRNDMLVNADAEHIAVLRGKFGVPAGKRVMLYAPTFRDDKHVSGVGYTGSVMLDFDALRERIGGEWVVLFRPHYFIADSFDFSKYGGFVLNAAKADEIAELMLVSDVLITDYSSVMFDYANLRRPMLFYMYDFEQYRDEIRGFYFGVDELPGPIVKTQPELEEELDRLDEYEARFGEKYSRFRVKYVPLDDGAAARRAAELLKR